MDSDKLCPILAAGTLADPGLLIAFNENGEPRRGIKCVQGKCALWTMAYTSEGYAHYACAFVINAMKDSTGRIPV